MKTQNLLKNRALIFMISFMMLFLFSYCNKSKSTVNSTDSVSMDTINFKRSNPKTDGYVPNSETAIKIAEAIWLPIYGNSIYENKPFVGELINDSIWSITGTVHTDFGGAPYAEIRKSDGKVIKITHYK